MKTCGLCNKEIDECKTCHDKFGSEGDITCTPKGHYCFLECYLKDSEIFTGWIEEDKKEVII